jgi:hypothetical protein
MDKTSQTGFRLTQEEYDALYSIAEIEERNISDILRRLIRQEAKRIGVWKDKKIDTVEIT